MSHVSRYKIFEKLLMETLDNLEAAKEISDEGVIGSFITDGVNSVALQTAIDQVKSVIKTL